MKIFSGMKNPLVYWALIVVALIVIVVVFFSVAEWSKKGSVQAGPLRDAAGPVSLVTHLGNPPHHAGLIRHLWGSTWSVLS